MEVIQHNYNFNEFCKLNSFEIKRVNADGHCFIYSCLESYYGNLEKYDDLLNKISNEVLNNSKDYKTFFGDSDQQVILSLQDYVFNKKWNQLFCIYNL